jgi:hypothetical protein
MAYIIPHQLPISTALLYTGKYRNWTQKQLFHVTIILFDQKVNKDSFDITKAERRLLPHS